MDVIRVQPNRSTLQVLLQMPTLSRNSRPLAWISSAQRRTLTALIAPENLTAVLTEANTLTDSSFVLLAGTEVSGAEQGPQSGSDSADILCSLGWGAHNVHHMGAHNITSRKAGGKDGFLDFCDNPMSGQKSNSLACSWRRAGSRALTTRTPEHGRLTL